MSKEQVIDYVMTTPGNPNRAVLSGMLDSLTGSDAGGLKNKTLTITAVDNASLSLSPLFQGFVNENGLVKRVGQAFPTTNETKVITTLVVPAGDLFSVELPILPMSTTGSYSYIASDEINCSIDEDGESVLITDINSDASITITVIYTSGDGGESAA